MLIEVSERAGSDTILRTLLKLILLSSSDEASEQARIFKQLLAALRSKKENIMLHLDRAESSYLITTQELLIDQQDRESYPNFLLNVLQRVAASKSPFLKRDLPGARLHLSVSVYEISYSRKKIHVVSERKALEDHIKLLQEQILEATKDHLECTRGRTYIGVSLATQYFRCSSDHLKILVKAKLPMRSEHLRRKYIFELDSLIYVELSQSKRAILANLEIAVSPL